MGSTGRIPAVSPKTLIPSFTHPSGDTDRVTALISSSNSKSAGITVDPTLSAASMAVVNSLLRGNVFSSSLTVVDRFNKLEPTITVEKSRPANPPFDQPAAARAGKERRAPNVPGVGGTVFDTFASIGACFRFSLF